MEMAGNIIKKIPFSSSFLSEDIPFNFGRFDKFHVGIQYICA